MCCALLGGAPTRCAPWPSDYSSERSTGAQMDGELRDIAPVNPSAVPLPEVAATSAVGAKARAPRGSPGGGAASPFWDLRRRLHVDAAQVARPLGGHAGRSLYGAVLGLLLVISPAATQGQGSRSGVRWRSLCAPPCTLPALCPLWYPQTGCPAPLHLPTGQNRGCCCCCVRCGAALAAPAAAAAATPPPHTATNRSLARLVHLRTPARPVPPFPLPYVAVPVSSSNAPSALMPRSCPSRRAKSPLLRWRRKIPPAAERARPR